MSAYVCTDVEHGPYYSLYSIVVRKPGKTKPLKEWEVFNSDSDIEDDYFDYDADFTDKLAKRYIKKALQKDKARISKLKLKALSTATFKKKRHEKFTVKECQLPHGKLTITDDNAYWKPSGKPEAQAFPTIPKDRFFYRCFAWQPLTCDGIKGEPSVRTLWEGTFMEAKCGDDPPGNYDQGDKTRRTEIYRFTSK